VARTRISSRSMVTREELTWVSVRLSSTDPADVKRGLQDACDLIERGRYFSDHSLFLTVIPRFIEHSDTKVRRWAYKLAALLRNERLLPHLIERFGTESDIENISWIVSAVFGLMTDRDIESWLRAHDEQFFGTYLELAARLYQRSTFLENKEAVGTREFEADPMVRKWASLLWGYGEEVPRGILGYNAAADLVGNLVTDDHEESVEYAIWAQHKRPEGSARSLILSPTKITERRAANVRRWLYRLITKNARSARGFRDLVLAGMNDVSVDAREGLALGIGGLAPFGLEKEILQWFEQTSDSNVRLALVDHLARASEENIGYHNTLIAWYARSPIDTALRRKIDAAVRSIPAVRNAIEPMRAAENSAAGPSLTTVGAASILKIVSPGGPLMVNIADRGGKIANIVNSELQNVTVNVDELCGSILNNLSGSSDPILRKMSDAIVKLVRMLQADEQFDHSLKAEILSKLHVLSATKDPAQQKSIATTLLALLKGVPSTVKIAADLASAIAQLSPYLGALIS
jgi:hypothetical protein